MRNKPRIRFKGFTEDWEQRKLSDITEIVMGQSPSSKNYTDNPNDNILVQGNADLKDGKVVPRLWTKEITKTIDKDGIILTVRAPVGDVARTDYKVVLGRGVAGIKGNDYIYQFLQKLQNNRYWVSLSSGSTFESINSNDIKDLIIDIPSVEEQTKISMLLNNVNSIITLHQRKLEKLKLAKKTLLQKLFPKNGSQFPEIRFKGFTDAWEQCKLRDLAEIVRGASPRPISDPKWFNNDSNVGWLRIADVTAQDGRIRYLEQKISELGQEKTRVIKTPHLLLSIAATVGKPVINYVPTGVHDGFLIFLNPKFNILYAFWWLEMFREKWNKYGQPGSQVNLNSDLVKNQVINIPNEKEQEKISSFLESLDKIITLHQCKLDKLQDVKKGLLQKMFV